MKRIIFIISGLLFFISCSGTKRSSVHFSKADKEKLSSFLVVTLKAKTDSLEKKEGAHLSETFYGELYEVNPDYVMSILDENYPSTPDSVFLQAIVDAGNDIVEGRLKIKKYGLGVYITSEDGKRWNSDKIFMDLMMEKYGVDIERIAGDMINSQIKLYAESYNSISESVINQFYEVEDLRKIVWNSISIEIDKQGKYRPEWEYKEINY